MHWFLEAGIIPDPKFNENDLVRSGVREETYLLGNLEQISRLVMKNNPDIFTIYLSTKSGQNIQYDADAALKASLPVPVLQNRPWYVASQEGNGLYISDAYRDDAGRGLTISIAMPFYGTNSDFLGVIGIDIKIEDLDASIRKTVVGKNGYALLLNNNNENNTISIISAPNLNESNENDIAAYLGSNRESLLSGMKGSPSGIGQSALAGGEGTEGNVYVVWGQVKLTQWHLVYVVPVDDIIAPAAAIRNNIVQMTESTAQRVDNRILTAVLILAALLVLIIFTASGIALVIAGKIVRPIITLTQGVKKLGNGNLDYHSDIHTGDEIEELSLNFEHMTEELRSYIDNLSRVTAEKERIGTELNVATKIQASMLPRIFPPFPDHKEFDIYASMLPAKEVGGDFYDFFLVNNNTLAVLIADVSGKGVPAALFMVITKTLIKNNAQNNKNPQEVFDVVNSILCESNEENMFVTSFMGYLDIPTGKFTYVNAGHNSPLIKQGENFQWLKAKPGFVLAGMPDMVYKQAETVLNPGDVLYLYTDGVTEAVNTEQELFSDPKLLEAANKYKNYSLKEFAISIKDEIDQFAQGAEQADDITMLVLQYKGRAQ
jgi:sigma-B regulation protein RsbU (phosphoserine phosphatase)